jgi:hypothetical protein
VSRTGSGGPGRAAREVVEVFHAALPSGTNRPTSRDEFLVVHAPTETVRFGAVIV